MINKKDILTRIRAAESATPISAYATEIPNNSYVVGNQTSQMVYNQTPEKDMGTGNRDGFAGELNKMASNTYLEKIASMAKSDFDFSKQYNKNYNASVNKTTAKGTFIGGALGNTLGRALKGPKAGLAGMAAGAVGGTILGRIKAKTDKSKTKDAFVKTVKQDIANDRLNKSASMAAIKSWPARLVKDLKDAPPLNQLGLAGGAVFGLGKAKGGYDSHKSSKHHANLEERSLKALHKINKNLGQALPVTSKV